MAVASSSLDTSIPTLEPNHNGVSSADVDWLARGASLKEKPRTRSRSASLPTNTPIDEPRVSTSSTIVEEDSDNSHDSKLSQGLKQSYVAKSSPDGSIPIPRKPQNGGLDTAASAPGEGFDSYDFNPFNTNCTSTSPTMTRGHTFSGSLTKTSHLDSRHVHAGPSARKGSWISSISAKLSNHDKGSVVVNGSLRQPVAPIAIPATNPKPPSALIASSLSPTSTRDSTSSTSTVTAMPIPSHSGLPTSSIIDSHPPRTASPKINPEPAIGYEIGRSPGSTGSFVNRLRRLSTRSSVTGFETPNGRTGSPQASYSRVVLNRNPKRHDPKIPEIANALPPRVAFSIDVLDEDPPQQIPSRNPRAGNITFEPNGEIKRVPLTTSTGLPLAQTYVLPRNYGVSTRAASQSAYESACRIAQTVKSNTSGGGGGIFRSKSSAQSNGQSSEDYDAPTSTRNLNIDKPMHNAERLGDRERRSSKTSETSEDSESSPVDEGLSLEAIYTRCCHLREILPIAAMMKQIKDREAPLEGVRMMNPRPTLIEILALGDFLTVVPVLIITLDNVSLSAQMIRILLGSLRRLNRVARLSLRNTVLDKESWNALCAFISENTSLEKLDLSMTRSKPTKGGAEVDRSDLDWSLLTKALVARKSIDELVLTGCMVPTEDLRGLILDGCGHGNKRLGLALNDLREDEIDIVTQWLQRPDCTCEGLDLGGNTLSGKRSWKCIEAALSCKTLICLSLHSTGLTDVESAAKAFKAYCEVSNLRLLDVSCNPDLFPGFTDVLADVLPKFRDLRRFHIDGDHLRSVDVIELADAFVRCPNLVHISIKDNRDLEDSALAALTVATHLSSTICTVESEADIWPPLMQRRLTHNCIVNMEVIAGRITRSFKSEDDVGLFGKDELMYTGNTIARSTVEVLKYAAESGTNDKHENLLAEELTRRAKQIRISIRQILDELFAKRRSDEGLTIEEKERLVRLCFLDGTLEKVLLRYSEQRARSAQAQPAVVAPADDANGAPASDELPQPNDHLLDLSLVDRKNLFSGTPNMSHPDFNVSNVNDSEETASIISRKSSSTSIHRRKQELEEGELYKLGTYLSRQRLDDGDSDIPSSVTSATSGEQIRQAYLKAKGSQSVSELIQKLEKVHGPELHEILKSTVEGEAPSADGTDKQGRSVQPDALDSVVDDLAEALS